MLRRTGGHRGIATARDIDVAMIGVGFAAAGLRYVPLTRPFVDKSINNATIYHRDARAASRTLVYRLVELTRLVSPKYGGGYNLHPGQEVPYSGIFVVKSGRFDSIMLYGSLAYTKFDVSGGYPTSVGQAPSGAVLFTSANNDPGYDSIEVTLDEISLW